MLSMLELEQSIKMIGRSCQPCSGLPGTQSKGKILTVASVRSSVITPHLLPCPPLRLMHCCAATLASVVPQPEKLHFLFLQSWMVSSGSGRAPSSPLCCLCLFSEPFLDSLPPCPRPRVLSRLLLPLLHSASYHLTHCLL